MTGEIPASIFDTVSKEYLDLFQVTLLEVASTTHLPEIYSIFGQENFLKFLDIFSGTTIKVPSRQILDDCMRDVGIFLKLKKSGVEGQALLVRDLSVQHSLPPVKIRKIFVDMGERLKRYKFYDR
jgi:hypothetical protein